jgi:hypothetical protein
MGDGDQSGDEDASSPCRNRREMKKLNSFPHGEIAVGSRMSFESSAGNEGDYKAYADENPPRLA